MKLIDFEMIKDCRIKPIKFYEWANYVISHKDEMILPTKISMKPFKDDVFYNCMPSAISSVNKAGIKIVTRYPNSKPSLRSLILLYDLNNGTPLALMDGTYITAMRTGAVAVHSINLLAKSNWESIAFIGLGNTARATLQVLLDVFPNKNFTIKILKYKNQHEEFYQRFKKISNLKFEYHNNMQEVVSGTDIIVSAVTYFDLEVCNEKYFDEGCLLIPIHTRGFSSCDLKFDKVYADDINHIKGFKNFNYFNYFAEIADIVSGKYTGRGNDKERILVYNIGLSIHDIYCASQIYDSILHFEKINIKFPKEKFWL